MLKKCIPAVLAFLLVLSACGPAAPATPNKDDTFTVVATTYPVYLFATEVTKGVPGLSVTLLVNQPVSCLHDYTLSVHDMKVLEGADLIVRSGAGLEDSMASTLNTVKNTPQIDCAQAVSLLTLTESAGQTAEPDPHIWLDPIRAGQMIETLAQGLAQEDPDHAQTYLDNAKHARDTLTQRYETMKASLADLSCRELITFHDGFQYFAQAFDLTILRSIEEEAGSEASAQEVGQIVADIKTKQLPAIFTEKNGATATAELIRRETGVPVFQLDLMMSGEGTDLSAYLTLLQTNVDTIREAYA